MSALFTTSGVHAGWAWSSAATTPDTIGAAIDVPPARMYCPLPVMQAGQIAVNALPGARFETIFEPGAQMSGLATPCSVFPAELQVVGSSSLLALMPLSSTARYSSLSCLHSLPQDILKIAKPFADDLCGYRRDSSFVKMIIELARTLELDVVAEGIEQEGQLAALRELGCGFGQGFLFGHPATPRAEAPSAADAVPTAPLRHSA